ncbi:MAG: cell division protein ZapA [Myxococcales bacterium]|nr:cell division protein ZapA [Myxococcales bacterium]
MQSRGPVAVTVGGQAYRLVASVPEEDLRRLAAVVDARIREIVPRGKPVTANAVLLAAMSLAHDLEAATGEKQALEAKSRDLMRRLLTRIDEALDAEEPTGQAEVGVPASVASTSRDTRGRGE